MNHTVRSLVSGVGAVAFVLAATPTFAGEEKKTEKRETDTEVIERESPPRVLEKRERVEAPSPSTKEHTVVKKKEKREVEEEVEDEDDDD